MTAGKRAVLLLAHGTPETVEEIPEYLKNVVSGRALPQAVVEEIQHRYALIGKSPLTDWTLREAELLAVKLKSADCGDAEIPVYVGMRNWKPYIADTVRRMRADGVTEAVAICLAPQNSRTSVGLYRRAALAETGAALAEAGAGEGALQFHFLQFHFIDAWADHPQLIAAFAERLQGTWKQACDEAGARVPVIFTAHSVPCRTVQTAAAIPAAAENSDIQKESVAGEKSGGPVRDPMRGPLRDPVRPTLPERSYAGTANAALGPDPYAIEAKRTATRVAEKLRRDGLTERDWYFAFQSQGASGGPWIGPTVEETLQALRAEGHTSVVLQPIGFLCDHVEILYDIDIAFQAQARKLGMKLWRPESLNDSPLLIAALAELAQTGFAALDATQKANAAIAVTPSR